jgi:hypothetical protein
LHDGREDTDHGRRRHNGEAVTSEYLSQKYGKRREQDGRQHEAVPEKLEAHPARLEAFSISSVGLRRMSG